MGHASAEVQEDFAELNKAILVGNLTRDPEMHTTHSGKSVCKFTLAINRRHLNAEGRREADFVNVVAWSHLAEGCGKYLSQGSKATVVGSIQTRSYDAQDGSKRYITEVIAEEVEFLTRKGKDPHGLEEPNEDEYEMPF